MKKNNNETWSYIENIFEIIPLPQLMILLILSISIFLIYVFLTNKIKPFGMFGIEFNLINQILEDLSEIGLSDQSVLIKTIEPYIKLNIFSGLIVISSISLLIPFELLFIINILYKMKPAFRNINISINDDTNKTEENHIYINLKNTFGSQKYYSVVYAVVVLPFVIISLIRVHSMGCKNVFLYCMSMNSIWNLIVDIYRSSLSFIAISLLATIFWIIINIFLSVREMDKEFVSNELQLDLIHADKLGGLSSIKNLILKGTILYSICISIAIMSYFRPIDPFSYRGIHFYYEIIYLIILFLLGFIFLVLGLKTLKRVIKSNIKKELGKISDRFERLHLRFLDLASKDKEADKNDELSWISTALDALSDERDRLLAINSEVYDIKTFSIWLTSIALPAISGILPTYLNEIIYKILASPALVYIFNILSK
jgi:hypothetical protein